MYALPKRGNLSPFPFISSCVISICIGIYLSIFSSTLSPFPVLFLGDTFADTSFSLSSARAYFIPVIIIDVDVGADDCFYRFNS